MAKDSLTYKKKLKPSERTNLWLSRIFIWIMLLVVLYPILYVVSSSLSDGNAFFTGKILSQKASFDNYIAVIKDTDFLIWLKNSMMVCITVASIQVFISLTAAYAFSRMRFKGKSNGLLSLLILQMFPAMMAIPAILGVAFYFGLMDNLWALVIILCGGSAYNIWLLKGFIDGIPKDLDEAAMVDGATHWQTFTKIILPLSKPMIAVMFLFCFMGLYSEFVITSALIKDPANYTMTLGLQSFIKDQFSANWTKYSAAAIMASLPLVIIFMSLQKHVEKGLTSGAVKG